MTDLRTKRAILAALSHEPDFSALGTLPPLDTAAGRRCSQWLDRSGLALSFFRKLECHHATTQISEAWRHAFEQRRDSNLVRMQDMLVEAKRINSAFRSFGVTAAFLKGFTLTPDFCDHPSLRHQVDIDVLVAPKDTQAAAQALSACGYGASRVNESGETCFLTPLRHIPSRRDDLYALPRQRQVDLHVSLWEGCPWLPVETPNDCLERTETHTICGFDYLSLSLEDKFLLQVLHAFHHSFRSWIRVSWLMEIGRCLEKHPKNADLWDRLIARAGNAALTRSMFSFVLGLVRRLFLTPIPPVLCSWTAEARTPRQRAWLDHFAFDWAVSDWPGTLHNLFLTSEFIPDLRLRMQYWRSRLLPKKVSASLGSVVAASPQELLQWQAARAGYVAHRAAVHLKGIATFPWQRFRWRRALESSRRLGLDPN